MANRASSCGSVSVCEETIAQVNHFLASGKGANGKVGEEFAKDLIAIYTAPFSAECELREQAAQLTGQLALNDAAILAIVIDDAKAYARHMHVDDSFPFSPNSFEVLGEIGLHRENAITFLYKVASEEFGIPRMSAIEALSKLGLSAHVGAPSFKDLCLCEVKASTAAL